MYNQAAVKGFTTVVDKSGDVYSRFGKKLCKWVVNTGYYQVSIHHKGKRHFRYVHRLVAEAFIPNPNNLPQVNHKDGDKLNNNVNNLEWVSNKQNTQHGYDNGSYKFKSRSVSVVATCKKTGADVKFKSIRCMCEHLKLNRKTVSAILHGSKKSNNYPYEFRYGESMLQCTTPK